MKLKSDVPDSLVMFMEDIGVPRKLIFDGSREQCMPGSEFMRLIKKNQIMWGSSEPYSQLQNQAELGVREIKGKVKHRRCQRNKHTAEVMNLTHKPTLGATPYE